MVDHVVVLSTQSVINHGLPTMPQMQRIRGCSHVKIILTSLGDQLMQEGSHVTYLC